MKKLIALTAALIISMTSITACSKKEDSLSKSYAQNTYASVKDINTKIDPTDIDVSYNEADACKIKLNNTKAHIDGKGAFWDDNQLKISKAGTYIVSGKLSDGRIIVDAGEDDKVTVVLNGVDVKSNSGSPLTVLKAEKVSVLLDRKSQNKFEDSSEYKDFKDKNEIDACIFSKEDLTVKGTGSLKVRSNNNRGIHSKNDLVFNGGKITVTSKHTAVCGKDSLKISAGEFDICSETNAFKSYNCENISKGFISVTGGIFKIVSNKNAFEAAAVLKLDDGKYDITTGGGSKNASTIEDATPNSDWHSDMQNSGGGKEELDSFKSSADKKSNNKSDSSSKSSDNVDLLNKESSSEKALKSGGELEITGGTFDIDSADDAVNSNYNVNISGGNVNISSGDDGIHADMDLFIKGGKINITKAYEGVEGMTVTISGGEVNICSCDDGINCAGGSDTGSENRKGRNDFESCNGVYLEIVGGKISINSDGDGLDSNGDLYVEGGITVIYGPSNSENGAIDYDGEAKISGGSIVAMCASGIEHNFSKNSKQCSVLVDFDSEVEKDTELVIKDSKGKVLFSEKNQKQWQCVVFSSSNIKKGKKYTVTAGKKQKDVEVKSIITGKPKNNRNL